jgi:hypothetical protein
MACMGKDQWGYHMMNERETRHTHNEVIPGDVHARRNQS